MDRPGSISSINESPQGGKEKLLFALFVLGVAMLTFMGGSLLTLAGITPGPQIKRAFEGGKAYYFKLFSQDDVYSSDLWYPTMNPGKGVTIYDLDKANYGVTLYTSGHEASAFLISMDGNVLHKWHRPYSRIWNENAAVKRPQPDSHVYMRKARMDGDGNLLAIYEGVGDTPYGYGLVKLDKDSNVIWSYLQAAHHDFDVAQDGRIFVLTHGIVDNPLKDLDHLASPRFEDYLVVLSPEGKELRKIPLLNAVNKSDYRRLLYQVTSFAIADPLHTNSVHVVTDQEAVNFRFARPGQVLISFRELGAVGVLDPDEEKLVWAVKGYWTGQHDPEILANGNLLLFDNLGHFNGKEGRSRALEFDPKTLAIIWQFTGSAKAPLESAIRSYTQRLPNGNTLITESGGGRILEVTPDKEIVWEYVNPIRGGQEKNQIPIICKAQRLPSSAAAFLNRKATARKQS